MIASLHEERYTITGVCYGYIKRGNIQVFKVIVRNQEFPFELSYAA